MERGPRSGSLQAGLSQDSSRWSSMLSFPLPLAVCWCLGLALKTAELLSGLVPPQPMGDQAESRTAGVPRRDTSIVRNSLHLLSPANKHDLPLHVPSKLQSEEMSQGPSSFFQPCYLWHPKTKTKKVLSVSIQGLWVKRMGPSSLHSAWRIERKGENTEKRDTRTSVRARPLADGRAAWGNQKDRSRKPGRLRPENEGVASLASGWWQIFGL